MDKPKRINIKIDVKDLPPVDRLAFRRHIMNLKIRHDAEEKGDAGAVAPFIGMPDEEFAEKFQQIEHIALYFNTVRAKEEVGAMVVQWAKSWSDAGETRQKYSPILDAAGTGIKMEPEPALP